MTEEIQSNLGHLEKITRKVKITMRPVKLDLQIVTTAPITFEKISKARVTLEEILNRLSGEDGEKYLQIIVHANLFELAAKTLLMNYFAKRGIDADEWREHISGLTLGNSVKWLARLGLIDEN